MFHGSATARGFLTMCCRDPNRDTTLVLLRHPFHRNQPHIRAHLDELEGILFDAVPGGGPARSAAATVQAPIGS